MTEFKVGGFVRVSAGPHRFKTGVVVARDPENLLHESGTVAVSLHEYKDYVGENDYHTFYPQVLTEIAEFNFLNDSVESVREMTFADRVKYRTNKIADLLIAKNEAYGDSALNPVRVFSKAEPVEQIKVRIDDKISRLQRGTDAGEDTITDLIGYLILLQIAEDSE